MWVENLRCLKDVSGWDVVSVEGTDIQMKYKDEIAVSFNLDNLRHGGLAKVDIPMTSDPVLTFTYSTLTTLKGDVRTVLLHPTPSTNPRSSTPYPKHTISPPSSTPNSPSSNPNTPSPY